MKFVIYWMRFLVIRRFEMKFDRSACSTILGFVLAPFVALFFNPTFRRRSGMSSFLGIGSEDDRGINYYYSSLAQCLIVAICFVAVIFLIMPFPSRSLFGFYIVLSSIVLILSNSLSMFYEKILNVTGEDCEK